MLMPEEDSNNSTVEDTAILYTNMTLIVHIHPQSLGYLLYRKVTGNMFLHGNRKRLASGIANITQKLKEGQKIYLNHYFVETKTPSLLTLLRLKDGIGHRKQALLLIACDMDGCIEKMVKDPSHLLRECMKNAANTNLKVIPLSGL